MRFAAASRAAEGDITPITQHTHTTNKVSHALNKVQAIRRNPRCVPWSPNTNGSPATTYYPVHVTHKTNVLQPRGRIRRLAPRHGGDTRRVLMRHHGSDVAQFVTAVLGVRFDSVLLCTSFAGFRWFFYSSSPHSRTCKHVVVGGLPSVRGHSERAALCCQLRILWVRTDGDDLGWR